MLRPAVNGPIAPGQTHTRTATPAHNATPTTAARTNRVATTHRAVAGAGVPDGEPAAGGGRLPFLVAESKKARFQFAQQKSCTKGNQAMTSDKLFD